MKQDRKESRYHGSVAEAASALFRELQAEAEVAMWVCHGRALLIVTSFLQHAPGCPHLGIMYHNKQSAKGVEEVLRGVLGLLVTHLKLRTFSGSQTYDPGWHQDSLHPAVALSLGDFSFER